MFSSLPENLLTQLLVLCVCRLKYWLDRWIDLCACASLGKSHKKSRGSGSSARDNLRGMDCTDWRADAEMAPVARIPPPFSFLSSHFRPFEQPFPFSPDNPTQNSQSSLFSHLERSVKTVRSRGVAACAISSCDSRDFCVCVVRFQFQFIIFFSTISTRLNIIESLCLVFLYERLRKLFLEWSETDTYFPLPIAQCLPFWYTQKMFIKISK
jgi:hypothetical protein